MLTLVGSQGNWVRFDKAWDPDSDTTFPSGWVAGGMLTTNLKTPAEYGPETQPKLHSAPAANAPTEPIPFDPLPEVTVTGCDGNFLKVKVKVSAKEILKGYLDSDSHCGNPVTNCS